MLGAWQIPRTWRAVCCVRMDQRLVPGSRVTTLSRSLMLLELQWLGWGLIMQRGLS